MTLTICKWDGCDRPVEASGYCKRCYQRARRSGLSTGPVRRYERQAAECSQEACDRFSKARGLCQMHYLRLYRTGDPGVVRIEKRPDVCTVEGCTVGHKARGYCEDHYNRWKRHGDPLAEVQRRQRNLGQKCAGPDCTRQAVSKGLCGTHDMQRRTGGALTPIREHKATGAPCEVANCDGESLSDGLCSTHYRRRLRGTPDWDAPIKRRAPRGTGHVDDNGYRIITVNGKAKREHRHVAEQLLGRPLHPWEDVHHKNTNRSDNRTDGPFRLEESGNLVSGNLVIWLHSVSQPRGGEAGPVLGEMRRRVHVGEGTEQDRELLALYGELVPEAGSAGG
jgi:hypothetical protein